MKLNNLKFALRYAMRMVKVHGVFTIYGVSVSKAKYVMDGMKYLLK